MKKIAYIIIALSLATLSIGSVGAEAQSAKLDGLQEWVDKGEMVKLNGYNIFLYTAGKAKTKGHGVPGELVVQFKYLSIPERPLWVVSGHLIL